jgi:autotransporter translocation and assembly factor TamB
VPRRPEGHSDSLTLPALGVSYEQGEIAGRLDGDVLRIERLRLLTGKKEVLDGQGTVHLKPLTDPGLDLNATLADFLISDSPTLRTSASGKIALSGTVSAPSVTGALNLGPTDVFVGAAAAVGKVERVDLTPEDLRRLSRDFGPSVLLENAKEEPGLMDRLRMDIALRLPRRVWIRKTKSPEANIELSGNMRLKQEPGGDMQFVGKVEPIPGRGSLDLSGRTFRLTGGEINLNGPVDSTRLDVTAEYQVPTQGGGEDNGILITVAAKGRLDSLSLDFSSEPTMSQEDVLSYIVTGHPASDNPLESSGGQGLSGKQMAFGQLSQALSGTAGRQLGFDVFQIKTDPATGLSLAAGRYLSSRFFLNLKLPLGSSSANTTSPGQNLGPGFELEYSARRWLRANLRGGSLPPAILFRGRHAY